MSRRLKKTKIELSEKANEIFKEETKTLTKEKKKKLPKVLVGLNVNLHTGPDQDSTIIQKVTKGSLVDLLEQVNGWAKINIGGVEGWVIAWFLHKKS